LHCHPSFVAKVDQVIHKEAEADKEAFLVSTRLAKKINGKETLDADAKKD
jgi:hypothetical protein